ncbi:MAG TPA: hypothetical protein VNO30_39615 [Kofleriaceae bacterium]|nr:hypothetical protein [Kofleriaceae bacterium]
MCIFVGELPHVSVAKTRIFARAIAPGVQALAYQMTIASAHEVAMVLPLPVPTRAGEDAVRFISLERHPQMFEELDELFPKVRAPVYEFQIRGELQPTQLVVHEIGSFIASYVPSPEDFVRLDPRFRVPELLFDSAPRYMAYGFAVFQLRPGQHKIHPMAFTFPTSEPDQLYFPTVHLHDGRFHWEASFDHALYYQHPRCTAPGRRFGPFGDAVSERYPASYEGLTAPGQPVLRRWVDGRRPNNDTWIEAE